MHYEHRIQDCVTISELASPLATLAPAVAALANGSNKEAAPLIAIASRSDDIAAIETLAAELRSRFRHIVVAGTGGSGLSGRTLTDFISAPDAPRFHYLETIDPEVIDAVTSRLPVKDTCYLIISKSGTTVETLSQYYVLLEHAMRSVGADKLREHFILIAEPGNNPLRRSAKEHNLRVLDHDPDIGGRYAILTAVGLLPAAIAGLDIKALRRGAQSVVATLSSKESPPAIGAALQYHFIGRGYPLTVMLPYVERLGTFSRWFRQGWAESLGKDGKGSTPIRGVGTTDQHSQLQLYLDGPKDKLFTMIMLDRAGSGPAIPVPVGNEFDYLRGKTMGDVMAAQQKATYETLLANGCPVRCFMLKQLNAEVLGALLMHIMIEIILTAHLLDISPFGQPAVEHGKILARDYLKAGSL